MNKILYLFLVATSALFIGCSTPLPEPVKIEISDKKVDYLNEVKPILDKRCVSCHSCYNSPCQAKFSSFEGMQRGASKLMVYDALRFKAAKPTRLFIDATNEKEWREKGFFSLTNNFDANTSYNDSIMMHMLHDKKVNPEVIGSYKPEQDELTCPRNLQEMGDYLEDKPNHGMPYGFPELKESEYDALTQWIAQGSNGPTSAQQKSITTPSEKAITEIKKWEFFLNASDAKHALTARYLYEHFFLAHWRFKSTDDKEFYELVRSKTPSPLEIDVIPSVRPFDDPKVEKFYYRLQKIRSTIVHKTHMVVEFDDKKMARIKEQFIDSKWIGRPHYVNYETKTSANPFAAFAQIPVKSRYQFLLDNSNYVIMTFIRGPVCRGQMALNVIHDHFWVMFQDPEHDVGVLNPEFLLLQADNLSMPIETNEARVLDAFSDDYRLKYENYFKAKQDWYHQTYPDGQGYDAIWKGETSEDSPLLTVYRHFDSASVHHGVIGGLPRTMWVIDYAQFERVYYSLVAGYDVFGNISHQTNIRRYMDFLRLEGELNFLSFMPPETRLPMLKSWYINSNLIEDADKTSLSNRKSDIVYKTGYPKSEFIEEIVNDRVLKSTNIKFDNINYYKEGDTPPLTPLAFNNIEDVKNGFRSLTAPGTNFIQSMTQSEINNILLKINMTDGTNVVGTIVINRWHNNVDSMFSEEDTLDSSLDTIDFITESIGSYPNAFAIVDYAELPDFFDLIKNFEPTEKYENKINKYFVRRSNKNFWETFDWFQNDFNKKNPIQSGLYDLNRYYFK